jgi:hypothetical protein
MRKMWNIFIYYSAIKEHEILSFAGKLMELNYDVERDKPSSERQVSYIFTHMWNLDLKY